MKPKQVALYVRVSTEDQKTDMQVADLTEYLKKREYELYKIYEDKISGTSKTREQLDQLLHDAKKRKFDIVLVWKFDRFARSLKMLVDSLELFRDLGIDFISYRENVDTTTSMGMLIFHINSAYAEFEREVISERVTSGIKAKREKNNGLWGRRPLETSMQESIKEMITSGTSIRNTAKALHVSTRTVVKYKAIKSQL